MREGGGGGGGGEGGGGRPEEEEQEEDDLVGGLHEDVAPHGPADEAGVALVGAAVQQRRVRGLSGDTIAWTGVRGGGGGQRREEDLGSNLLDGIALRQL